VDAKWKQLSLLLQRLQSSIQPSLVQDDVVVRHAKVVSHHSEDREGSEDSDYVYVIYSEVITHHTSLNQDKFRKKKKKLFLKV
jgi:hypothetical protein